MRGRPISHRASDGRTESPCLRGAFTTTATGEARSPGASVTRGCRSSHRPAPEPSAGIDARRRRYRLSRLPSGVHATTAFGFRGRRPGSARVPGAALAAALREHGATVAHYGVLALLDEQPGLSNADLARRAFVTPQSMNQTLRELEDKAWVTRRPHPGHGRIRPAGLTRDGRTVLRACQQAAGAIEEQMLAGLSADRERPVRPCSPAPTRSRGQGRTGAPRQVPGWS
jgi:DNA-binding MarR family transcriptional regulator